MSLEKTDLELIERIVYKNADDIAISIARSFERLEERIDAVETRLYGRLAEVEDRLDATRQDLSDTIGNLKEELRDLIRYRDSA